MGFKKNNQAEKRSPVETLTLYAGLSIFWYFSLQLGWSIGIYFFTREFMWDFSYLLLFWMAYSVREGSTTACKWGILIMICSGYGSIAECFQLQVNPGVFEFENSLPPSGRPFYFSFSLAYVFWSILNIKYLLAIIRLKHVRFWTARTVVGYGISAVLLFTLIAAQFVDGAKNCSEPHFEKRYTEVGDYLQQAAQGNVPTWINAPQVRELAEKYPEIIEGIIRTNRRSALLIQFNKKPVVENWGGASNSMPAQNVRYATCSSYTKDLDGQWVKIELKIEKK